MDNELLTQEELCNWLKITPMTAYRWRKMGMPSLGSRKALRYRKSDVLRWLEQSSQKQKPQK